MNVEQQALQIRGTRFHWGQRTYLMGILNVTPDSFSDGGQFHGVDAALTQAQQLVRAGADILDVGGQSTRPGAETVSVAEELNRVVPVIQAVRQCLDVPISVDTTRADVATAALDAGADIVNDISGATFDENMLPVVAQRGVPIILMHIKGTPQTMQKLTDYQDLISEIYGFLQHRIEVAKRAGVSPDKIIIDPGIGFAKNYEQNLEIFKRLSEFKSLGCPMLVGPSRKSFIGHILNQPNPQARVWGTAAACCAAIADHTDILRVHDVEPLSEVCRVADALFR